jgi:hypothetical protein
LFWWARRDLNSGPEEDSPAKAFFFEHPWRKMNKLEQKIVNYQYCGKNIPKKIFNGDSTGGDFD